MDTARNVIGRGLAAIGRVVSVDDLTEVGQDIPINDPNREARAALERAQLERDRLLVEEERCAALERRAQQTREHEEGSFYTLCERMVGKRMDSTWKSYATNVISDYLDRNTIVHPKMRYDIISRVLVRYLKHIETEERLTLRDVMNIRDRNLDLEGSIDQTVWYNPWTWHLKQSIQGNDNGSWREHKLYSLTQVTAMGLVGVGVIVVGSYCTFRAWHLLKSSIIIPKAIQQPMLPTQIDIPQLSCLNTNLGRLVDCISTSGVSNAIQEDLLDKNTSTELIITLSGRCMKKLGSGLNRAVESLVEFVRSQR